MTGTQNGKPMAILFAAIFLVGMGFSMILPVLPFLAEDLGASAFQLGLLITVYAVCQFIFAPVWGAYSDRVGRKPVLLAGILGFSLTFILFGFATELWMLYLIRIAGGIFSCAVMPSAMAYIADSSSMEKRGAGMGMIGASLGMGMIFGPALGGLLTSVSLAFPFVFAGLLALADALAVWLLLPESLAAGKRVQRRVKNASLLEGLRTPIALFFVCMCLASMSESIQHGIFALFTGYKLSFNALDISWAFTAGGAVSALVQGLVVGRMINRLGEEKTLGTGIILLAISMVLFIYTIDIFTSVLFMSVFAAGVGLIRPAISSAVSKRTTMAQGSAMGILNGYDSLGRAIGPALGGFMLDRGLYYGYYTAIIISLLALLTLWAGARRVAARLQREEEEDENPPMRARGSLK